MRYCVQRNEFSCGPILIINALKWAGEKITYRKDYKELCELLKCSREIGTKSSYITRYIQKLNPRRTRSLSMKNNEAIMALYLFDPKENIYHYVLILPDLTILNCCDKNKFFHKQLTKKQLMKKLKKRTMWRITKKHIE